MLPLNNMRPGEQVTMVLRRHWIVYVMLGTYVLVGCFFALTLFLLIGNTVFSWLVALLFTMMFCLFLYIEWLNHELDMYIVTNNRIIGVEQISFLNRKVTECNLGQVQEVNSETKGFFANVLNYGTIYIQTAGSSANLKMDFAPDPLQSSRKVLNIVDDYRDTHNSMASFKREELSE